MARPRKSVPNGRTYDRPDGGIRGLMRSRSGPCPVEHEAGDSGTSDLLQAAGCRNRCGCKVDLFDFVSKCPDSFGGAVKMYGQAIYATACGRLSQESNPSASKEGHRIPHLVNRRHM